MKQSRRAIAALGFLSATCGLVWLVFFMVERLVQPGVTALPDSMEIALTDDWEALATAPRRRVPLVDEPAYVYAHSNGEISRALFIHDFGVTETSAPSALLLGWKRGVYEVRLNGKLLKTETPADRWGLAGGFEPEVFMLPAEQLESGANQLTFNIGGATRKIMPGFYLGSAADVFSAYRWGHLFTVEMVMVATGVMLFLALLLGVLRWPETDKVGIVALIVLLILWSLRNLHEFNADALLPFSLSRPLHFLLTYAFLLSFAVLTWAHTGARRIWLRATIVLGGLCGSVFLACYWLLPWKDCWRIGFDIESALTVATTVVVSLRLSVSAPSQRLSDALVSLLILICMTIVCVDNLDDRYALHLPLQPDLPLTIYVAPMSGLLLAFVVLLFLLRRVVDVRARMAAANEHLGQALAAREAELAVEYSLRTKAENERTKQEERRRILRGMHDGLGSRLSTLAIEAADPETSRDYLATELGQGLVELRLLVDALDSEGDTLAMALGSFRGRVEPALRRVGVALRWNVDADVVGPGFGAEEVLDVYRLLQEALRNVMQHANASYVEVSVRETPQELLIEVSDDGEGMAENVSAQQGIRGMRERAAAIGGSLTLQNTHPGFLVQVRVARQ